MRLVSLSLLLLALGVTTAAGQTPPGPNQDADSLYKTRCATCHEAGVARAPNRAGLNRLTPEAIGAALTSGSMREQGQSLTLAEVQMLARALGAPPATAAPATSNACTANDPAAFAKPLDQPNWNGWGANVAQHRFQTAAMARLSATDVPRLKLKWAFAFQGVNRMFAQPTIVGGRVFIGSASTAVYSLNATSGCQYWAFKPDAPVRTAITIGAGEQGRWLAYFGDQRANAYAVDAVTGALVWKRSVDSFPGATITGAPTLADGTLYVVTSSAEEVLGANPKYECCRFRGSLSALNATTGEVRWKTYTIPEEAKPVRKNAQGVQLWGPSGAGVWSSPAVDPKRGMVYITTGDAYSDPAASTSDAFMAFDIKTGKLLWTRQVTSGDAFNVACGLPEALRVNCPEAKGPDHDFGSSPILVDLPNGRRALIAGQKSGVVHAVDPDRGGEILWQTRVGKGSALGGVQWGSAYDGRRVYVALSDVIPETAGTAAAPPAPPAPAGQPPAVPGLPQVPANALGGGLFALDPASGQIVWTTPHPGCGARAGCSPAQSAAVTAIPGIVFSGGIDGHLRAYSSDKGAIVWDVDTMQPYTTVNGVTGNGGSLDGPGPVVAGGMVFVNSGYAFISGKPGNVLLAFSVDGR